MRPMCVPPAARRARGGTSTRCAARATERRDRPPQPALAEGARRAAHVCAAGGASRSRRDEHALCRLRDRATRPPSPARAGGGCAPRGPCVCRRRQSIEWRVESDQFNGESSLTAARPADAGHYFAEAGTLSCLRLIARLGKRRSHQKQSGGERRRQTQPQPIFSFTELLNRGRHPALRSGTRSKVVDTPAIHIIKYARLFNQKPMTAWRAHHKQPFRLLEECLNQRKHPFEPA